MKHLVNMQPAMEKLEKNIAEEVVRREKARQDGIVRLKTAELEKQKQLAEQRQQIEVQRHKQAEMTLAAA